MRVFRAIFQSVIVIAALVTGFRYAMGWSRTSIEAYCPFGGLEAALSLLTHRQFTCATGERNLTLFVALLGLTLVARKSFCSWICPVGTISEWIARLGRHVFPLRKDIDGSPLHALEPTRRWDRILRWLRLPVLVVILYFTFRTGELIFRGYDPYYILFSFHGHDVFYWSYIVIGVILLGIVVFPMAWCRYLCPLSAALSPFSAIGRLRIARNPDRCTSCGACDRVCPHSLSVSRMNQVTSGECTLCLECTEACPVNGALDVHLKGKGR